MLPSTYSGEFGLCPLLKVRREQDGRETLDFGKLKEWSIDPSHGGVTRVLIWAFPFEADRSGGSIRGEYGDSEIKCDGHSQVR